MIIAIHPLKPTQCNTVEVKRSNMKALVLWSIVILKKLTNLEYPGKSIGVVKSRNIKIHARRRWPG